MNQLNNMYVKTLTLLHSLMKDALMIDDNHSDPFGREVLAAFDAWGGSSAMDRVYSDENGNMKAELAEFLKTYEPTKQITIKTIAVTLTVPVGKASMSITSSCDIEPQQDAEAATILLWDAIQAQYQALSSRRGAGGVQPLVDAVVNEAGKPNEGLLPPDDNTRYEQIDVVSISCEVKDGKTYWKMHGGKYSKYGVRIWDEVMDESGIAYKGKTAGGDLKGKATVMLLKTDKGEWRPSKVVKFVKAVG